MVKRTAEAVTRSEPPRIFLSASVPLPSRNPTYYETADVIAIRDALRALMLVIIEQDAELVFGGHPAISPMIRLQVRQSGKPVGERIVLYQSLFFSREFPEDVKLFERVVYTRAFPGDREKSLAFMRTEMLRGPFNCGIFIGGMEGVEREYEIFKLNFSGVPCFPIASTGAAAQRLFQGDTIMKDDHPELLTELSYISLMRNLLNSTSAAEHGPTRFHQPDVQ